MSKRMYLSTKDGEYQVFENNGCPVSVIEALIKQGLQFNPKTDETFKGFKINDIQPIVDEIKNEFFSKFEKGSKVADFTSQFVNKNGELKEDKELYMTSYYILNNSYLFELYNLIQFLEPYIDFKKSSRFDDIFVLKNDADVTISMC